MGSLLALGAFVLVLAGFDAFMTARGMRLYGIEDELNPAIRWLAKHLDLRSAALAGVAIPTLIVICACFTADSPIFLALYAGVRLHLAAWQFRALKRSY